MLSKKQYIIVSDICFVAWVVYGRVTWRTGWQTCWRNLAEPFTPSSVVPAAQSLNPTSICWTSSQRSLLRSEPCHRCNAAVSQYHLSSSRPRLQDF